MKSLKKLEAVNRQRRDKTMTTRKKDQQRSTKHTTENLRLSITNPSWKPDLITNCIGEGNRGIR